MDNNICNRTDLKPDSLLKIKKININNKNLIKILQTIIKGKALYVLNVLNHSKNKRIFKKEYFFKHSGYKGIFCNYCKKYIIRFNDHIKACKPNMN